MRRLLVLPLLLLALPAGAQAKAKPTPGLLRAGAGQADITPPQTGYYLGGWTRADRVGTGVATRLYANALVLQRGTQKVALVAVELFAVPAGMQEDVARKVADLGYDRTTVLLSADHTHSGPGGYFNNPTYNTAAPSVQTATDPLSFERFLNPAPADHQLYTFLVDQIAAAIRRADGDRAPAAAGWGQTQLTGLTQNRSIEAHLRDVGVTVPFGQGTPQMDPRGVDDTIDPTFDLLRVDKLERVHGRTVHIPIGAYSTFANHGTVVKSETEAYAGDHQATAWRTFDDRLRKLNPRIPRNQTVVDVFANGAEGDQTSGIQHTGLKGAIYVGEREATAALAAWKGAKLSRTPVLTGRWTRTCFCGRQTATGPVASKGEEGLPFLTGSEEGRGPLYDLTHVPLEGMVSPIDDPVQGDKLAAPIGSPPPAVPIVLWRVGTGVIAGVPGEPTKEVGVRIRQAVLPPLAPEGVTHVVITGLADDYVQYITTPEEYEEQSYEGGSTLFGRNEATFLQERLHDLAGTLATGAAAPDPYPLDVTYGVTPDGAPYPAGADHGAITKQPAETVRKGSGEQSLAWDGGPDGHDRPVDKPFVSEQRLVGRRWRTVDSDLGIDTLWRVDDAGHYTLTWDPEVTIPAGTYRFRVTATRYMLLSDTFAVTR